MKLMSDFAALKHKAMTHSQYPSLPDGERNFSIQVECEHRWEVYKRLQELDISCKFQMYAPLAVQIVHPTDAMQLWSILQRTSMPRNTLIGRLQNCWQLPPAHRCAPQIQPES